MNTTKWLFGKSLTIVLDTESKVVLIDGIIDQSFDNKKIQIPEGIETLSIDLLKLSYINSYGIREFILWLNALSNNRQIFYVNCPVSFVHQANMVAGIIKSNVMIQSFFAPYFNEQEDKEENILLHAKDIINLKMPSQTNLVFDWDEKSFLLFLEKQGKLT